MEEFLEKDNNASLKLWMEAMTQEVRKMNARMDAIEELSQPKVEIKSKPFGGHRHKNFRGICYGFDPSESICDNDSVQEPISELDEVDLFEANFSDVEEDLPIKVVSNSFLRPVINVYDAESMMKFTEKIDQVDDSEDSSLCAVDEVEIIEPDILTNEDDFVSSNVGEVLQSNIDERQCAEKVEVNYPIVEVIEFVIPDIKDKQPMTLDSILSDKEDEVQSKTQLSVIRVNSQEPKDQHSRSNVFEEWGNDTSMDRIIQDALGLSKVKKPKWNTRKPWRSKHANIGFKRQVWASQIMFGRVQAMHNHMGIKFQHYNPYSRWQDVQKLAYWDYYEFKINNSRGSDLQP